MSAYIYGARRKGAITTPAGETIYPATFRYKPIESSSTIGQRWNQEQWLKRCGPVTRSFRDMTVLAAVVGLTQLTFAESVPDFYEVYRAVEGVFSDDERPVGKLIRRDGQWVLERNLNPGAPA